MSKTAVDECRGPRPAGFKVKSYENVDARGQDASGKQVVEPGGGGANAPAAFPARSPRERTAGDPDPRVYRPCAPIT